MKTYCISDIHGHLNNLKAFTKTLSKDDRVFVLGDVVDKGPDSIDSLQFVMNDERFNMILGNHDFMMLKYITASNDFVKYTYYDQWIMLNEGGPTYNNYLLLDDETKQSIIDYLSNLPICLKIKVSNRYFFLAHADPNASEEIKADDNVDIVEESVWKRLYKYDCEFRKNETVVIGHTPVQAIFDDTICKPYFNAKTIDKANLIVIDGGLAAVEITKGKLIALCLDDLTYKTY